MNLPMYQVRTLIDRCVAELDQLPTRLARADEQPIVLTLELKLDIDQQTTRAFTKR